MTSIVSRHLSCVIRRDPQTVYDCASDPGHLSQWAHGLAEADVHPDGEDLLMRSPMGEVRVRFVPKNGLGVIDHDVILPSGITVTNPMRVLVHPEGYEVVFTVRQIDLTDEEFDRDCRMVEEDLARLKAILEH